MPRGLRLRFCFHVDRDDVILDVDRDDVILDNASRAKAAVLFLARSAMSGSLARVMIPLGPGILSFMYP